jgi:hypothetical protein
VTTLTRDELAERAYPLVAIEARRFPSLPAGMSAEDLESLGGEVLLAAAAEYDGPDEGWRRWAKFYLRNQMRSFVQKARARARRRAPLEVETEEGDFLPRPDPRTADPADLAATRELIVPPRRGGPASVTKLARSLPSPAIVAGQVNELRSAMFGALDPAKIGDMMRSLQDRAAEGDLKAIKLLMDLLAPGRSGVTLQQAVIINQGDLD